MSHPSTSNSNPQHTRQALFVTCTSTEKQEGSLMAATQKAAASELHKPPTSTAIRSLEGPETHRKITRVMERSRRVTQKEITSFTQKHRALTVQADAAPHSNNNNWITSCWGAAGRCTNPLQPCTAAEGSTSIRRVLPYAPSQTIPTLYCHQSHITLSCDITHHTFP
jgi:hypothetical protein